MLKRNRSAENCYYADANDLQVSAWPPKNVGRRLQSAVLFSLPQVAVREHAVSLATVLEQLLGIHPPDPSRSLW